MSCNIPLSEPTCSVVLVPIPLRSVLTASKSNQHYSARLLHERLVHQYPLTSDLIGIKTIEKKKIEKLAFEETLPSRMYVHFVPFGRLPP